MIRFIISMLLLLVGSGLIAWGFVARERRAGLFGGAALVLVFSLLFGIWSMVRIVPPRSIGIEVTFGKVTDVHNSGLHMTAPWASVKKFPATVQTTRLQNDGKGGYTDGPCVTVRLGNQTTACVNVTTQWQINTENTEEVKALYARWRSFGNIEPSLIRPQLQHSMLAPFETFDPLAVLQADGKPSVPTAQFETAARDRLQQSVGSGITITALTINLVQYDNVTQEKLNAYAQAIAETRITQQREQTAIAQRKANDALASSEAVKDPAVGYQNCLTITENLVKEGKALPPAWNCGTPPIAVVPVR